MHFTIFKSVMLEYVVCFDIFLENFYYYLQQTTFWNVYISFLEILSTILFKFILNCIDCIAGLWFLWPSYWHHKMSFYRCSSSPLQDGHHTASSQGTHHWLPSILLSTKLWSWFRNVRINIAAYYHDYAYTERKTKRIFWLLKRWINYENKFCLDTSNLFLLAPKIKFPNSFCAFEWLD